MCGFTGFVDVTSNSNMEKEIVQMANSLQHRGPDDNGYWFDKEYGVALAHMRLSILDLSELGHQPMLSESGRYVISYNGEIYNYKILRKELEEEGYRFRGNSDTEVLLGCIDIYGIEKTLPKLNGMFGFALWDRVGKVLYLARDRVGEKPVYYGWIDSRFFFGSELKAMKSHEKFYCEIDKRSIEKYLLYKYIPCPLSVFKGIYKLKAGAYLKLKVSRKHEDPEIKIYWDPEIVINQCLSKKFTGTISDAEDELEKLLKDSILKRMQSDVDLGVFLSGGIDSSLITAIAQRNSTKIFKTFSIGFEEDEYDEAKNAKAIAAYLGTDHSEHYFSEKEAIEKVRKLSYIYDEPFSDSSQLPTLLLSEITRNSVNVALSGDGADELFGGYHRYVLGNKLRHVLEKLPTSMNYLFKAGVRVVPECEVYSNIVSRIFKTKERTYNVCEKLYLLNYYLSAVNFSNLYQRMLVNWKGKKLLPLVTTRRIDEVLSTSNTDFIRDFNEKMMFNDFTNYLVDDILVKLDRASMAVSLEARIPFLDHRIIEFAWSLPTNYKIYNGNGKYILKNILNKYLPNELFERPKKGFSLPVARWLRGGLREWGENLLDQKKLQSQGYFDVDIVRKMWADHQQKRKNWDNELWSILMFQSWSEQWADIT